MEDHNFSEKIGSLIQIELDEGVYEGKVMNGTWDSVTLEDIVFGVNREMIDTVLTFRKSEIKKITILKGSMLKTGKSAKLSKIKYKPTHLGERDLIDYSDFLLNAYDKAYFSHLLTDEEDINYLVIDAINDTYYDLIRFIKTKSPISIGFQGVKLSRSGILCWLNICIDDKVFLFDIFSLKEKAFSEGLKNILENSKILKIIHNCRLVCDCLFHQYNVNMKNLFDTQVADIFLFCKQENGCVPRTLEPLPNILIKRLGIPADKLFFPVYREQHREADESVWKIRPLPEPLLKGSIINVMHLKKLRAFYIEDFLSPVAIGTDICLSFVRDEENPKEVERMIKNVTAIPRNFSSIFKPVNSSI